MGVRRKVAGEVREMPLAVNVADPKNAHTGIASIWASMKISDLGDRATHESNPKLAGLIKQTALEYGLMSAFTSFVATDSSQRSAGDHGTTVATPSLQHKEASWETEEVGFEPTDGV